MKSYAGAAPSTSVPRGVEEQEGGGGERRRGSAIDGRELDFGERDGVPLAGGVREKW